MVHEASSFQKDGHWYNEMGAMTCFLKRHLQDEDYYYNEKRFIWTNIC